MNTATQINTTTQKSGFLKIMGLAFGAGITSVIINLVLFFASKSLGAFPDNVFIDKETPLTALPLFISSMIPSLVAGVVMGLLHRFTKSSKKIFTIIAVVLSLLFFYPPFTIPNVPLIMALMLNVMHVVVALNLVIAFRKFIN